LGRGRGPVRGERRIREGSGRVYVVKVHYGHIWNCYDEPHLNIQNKIKNEKYKKER
jgi:hypothetical protein